MLRDEDLTASDKWRRDRYPKTTNESTLKQYRYRRRIEIALGDQCSRCGCQNVRFEIHHKNGGGSKDIAEHGAGAGRYKRILDQIIHEMAADQSLSFELVCTHHPR